MSVRVKHGDVSVRELARKLVEFAEGRSSEPPDWDALKRFTKEVSAELARMGYSKERVAQLLDAVKAKRRPQLPAPPAAPAKAEEAAAKAEEDAERAAVEAEEAAAEAGAPAAEAEEEDAVWLDWNVGGEILKSRALRVSEIPMLFNRMLLLGPPGVGKTERVLQLAKAEAARRAKDLGKELVEVTAPLPTESLDELFKDNNKYLFVDLRVLPQEYIERIATDPNAADKFFIYYRIIATHFFPEDVAVPRPAEQFARSLPLNVLKAMERAPGVLFIDEITNVSDPKQKSMYYSVLQEMEFGLNVRLNKDFTIVAAGNTTDYSNLAEPLPEPLRNRLTIINVGPPTIKEWAEYMDREHARLVELDGGGVKLVRNWDDTVLAFLLFKAGGRLDSTEPLQPPHANAVNPWENFPSPRAYTELALLLKNIRRRLATVERELRSAQSTEERERLEKEKENLMKLAYATILGRLGSEVGSEFFTFLRYISKKEVAEALERALDDPSVLNPFLERLENLSGKGGNREEILEAFAVIYLATKKLVDLMYPLAVKSFRGQQQKQQLLTRDEEVLWNKLLRLGKHILFKRGSEEERVGVKEIVENFLRTTVKDIAILSYILACLGLLQKELEKVENLIARIPSDAQARPRQQA